MKVTVDCNICGLTFSRCVSNKPGTLIPKFCSNSCKGEWLSVNQKGDNNPNFGNKWTDDQKKEQSKRVKNTITEETRMKSGSANRGKKFSAERISAMHSHRDSSSYSHPHSEETKAHLAVTSKIRFNDPDFVQRLRNTNEQNGNWIPISEKSDWDVYKKESHFHGTLNWFVNTNDEQELLSNFGLFNAFSNPTGLVRDHLFSRKHGFEQKVFCEILRHPANCRIITHSQNCSKRDKSTISLKELFEKILLYKKDWHEQDLVLKLINDYRNGKRWVRWENEDERNV